VDGNDRKYGASIHRRHDSAVTAGASLSPTYQPAANGQDRMPRLLQTVPHRERTAKDAAVDVRQTASSVNGVQNAKVMQQLLPERLPVEAYNNDCGNSHSGDGNPSCISSGKSHNNFSLVNGGKSHNSTVNIDNNNSVINSSTSNNNASSCNGSVNYTSNVNSGVGASDNGSNHNGGGHFNGSGHNGNSHNISGHNTVNGHNSSGHNNVSGHNVNSHNSSGHNSTNRHVVNFSIEKRKRIELTSLEPNSSSALLMPASPHITLESVTTASPIHSSSSNNSSMYTESPRKGGQSSYQEYFDNLISLIDEAARELSV
jgi:hypothetical protein